MLKKTLLFALTLILLSSCGKHAVKEYSIEDLVITAEAPLYEGTNTMQGIHTISLAQIDPQLNAKDIDHVKLIGATVAKNDSVGFNVIKSIALQLASADTPMQQAAILNPVQEGSESLELKPSSEADFAKLFKQEKVFVIADVDLASDMENDLSYKISMKFEVRYKQ